MRYSPQLDAPLRTLAQARADRLETARRRLAHALRHGAATDIAEARAAVARFEA